MNNSSKQEVPGTNNSDLLLHHAPRTEKMRKAIPTSLCGVCISITTVGDAGGAALINTTRIFRITKKGEGGMSEKICSCAAFCYLNCLNPRVYARPKNTIRLFFRY
jgi:hypothetical protein